MKLNQLFNQSLVDRYAASLQAQGLSSASIHRKLSSLNTFKKFLIRKRLLADDSIRATRYIPSSLESSVQNQESKSHRFFNKYLLLVSLVLIISSLGFGLYRQAILKAVRNLAYSTASSPIRPGRQLSFQGRLTDSFGNPIVSNTSIYFRLYNSDTGGTQLYTSEVGNSQTVTPDENGIFSVIIGKTHGTEIPATVFSENDQVWLEITSGGETMTPRQQIATVAYALNSETLQGLPPSASGYKNTVLVIDGSGNLNLGETSPTIVSKSGTLGIIGQALLIGTSSGSGGNITIAPDGSGLLKLIGTGVSGFIQATDANFSSGNFINTSINNDNRGYNFINFSNYNIGTTVLASRFSIDAYGNTNVGGTINATNISIGNTLVTTSAAELNYLDGLLPTNGSIVIGNGTALTNLNIGTSNYVLTSTGSVPTWTALPAVTPYTASNGITLSGNDFRLGGTLTQNTSIGTSSWNLSFLGLGNTQSLYIASTGYIGVGTTNPSSFLDISGNGNQLRLTNGGYFVPMSLDNTGLLGIGGASASGIYLFADPGQASRSILAGSRTINSASGVYGYNIDLHKTGSGGASGTLSFTYGEANTTGSNSLDGAYFYVNNGAYSAGYENGIRSIVTNNIGSTVTNYIDGIQSRLHGSLGVAATSVAFFHANNTLSSVTTPFLYGLYVDSLTQGASNYAIFTAGTTPSVFGGNVGIGTTNPQYKLDLQSNQLITAHFIGTSSVSRVSLDTTGTNTGFGLDIGGTHMFSNAVYQANAGNYDYVLYNDQTSTNSLFIDGSTDNINIGTTYGANIGLGSKFNINGNVSIGSSYVFTAAPTNGLIVQGNVGFGTANPFHNLDLGAGIGDKLAIYQNGSGTDFYGLGIASGQMYLKASNQQLFTLTNGGYVGVATSAPNHTFEVSSGNAQYPKPFNILSSTHATSKRASIGLGLDSGNTTGWEMGIDSMGSGTRDLFFFDLAANQQRMMINTSGNVGIGTTNPSKKLDIAGDLNLSGTIFTAGTSGASGQILSSTGAGLQWISAASVGTSYGATNGLSIIGSSIGLGGTLTQNTNIGTSSWNLSFLGLGNTQSLYIASNGYVGIGRTAPQYSLDINGTLRTTRFLTPYNHVFTVDSSGAGDYTSITAAINAIIAIGDTSAATPYTINVMSGTYPESVNLPNYVSLIGSGWFDTVINGTVTVNSGSHLQNLRVYPLGTESVSLIANPTIDSSYVTNLYVIMNNSTAAPTYLADFTGSTDFRVYDSFFYARNPNASGSAATYLVRNSSTSGPGDIEFHNTHLKSSCGTNSNCYLAINNSSVTGSDIIVTGSTWSVFNDSAPIGGVNNNPNGNIKLDLAYENDTSPYAQYSNTGNNVIISPHKYGNLSIDLGNNFTSGTGVDISFSVGTTLAGALIGQNIDLSNNLTYGNNAITGLNLSIPNSGSAISKGLNLTGAADFGIYANGETANYFSGNVGIGTTNPTSKLVVNGTGQFTGSSTPTSGAGAELFYSGSTSNLLSFDRSGGTFKNLALNALTTTFLSSDAAAMFIQNNGNIGIGTTNPGQKLEIVGGNILLADTGSKIYLDDGNTYLSKDASNLQVITNGGVNFDGSKYVFNTGNVGIGTTNPLYKLHVNGDALVATRLGIGSTNVNYTLNVGGSGLGVGGTVNFSGLAIGTTGTGTTAVFIDASGNLYKNKLGALAFQDSTAGTTYTASNGITLVSTDIRLGGNLTQNTSIGTSSFYLNFLGLGNTQSLYLANSGNVGIGMTAPTYKLQLAASGNIFSIGDTAGNELFSITDTAVTSNLPTNFTSSGDVSMAYDLIFTNQTSSFIKANAPLTIENGENYESNDLTLRTFNYGNIIMDAGSSGALIPYQNLTTNLGSSTNRWNNTWTNVLNVGASTWSLGSPDSSRFSLFNNSGLGGTEALTVLATGDIGVGTTAPIAKFNVAGTGRFDSYLTATTFYDTNSNYYLDPAGTTSLIVAGKVGIGTTNPTALLTIDGGAGDVRLRMNKSGTSHIILNHDGSRGVLRTESATPFDFGTNGATNMTILSGGNIGIGTTNPLYKLSVNGDALISTRLGIGSTDANYSFHTTTNGRFDTNLSVGGTATFDSLAIGATGTGTTAVFIDASGNLYKNVLGSGAFVAAGVGSTSYNATNGLTLTGSAFGLGGTLTTNTNIGVSSFGLSFLGINSNTQTLYISSIGRVGIGTTNPQHKLTLGLGTNNIAFEGSAGVPYGGFGWDQTLDALVIKTNNASSDFNGTPVVIQRTTGNVGIGTTNPYSKLSTIAGNSLSTSMGIYTSDFAAGSTGSALGMKFGATSGNTFSAIQAYITGANAFGNLSLNQDGGNVGIGTTNPLYKLQVENGAVAVGFSGTHLLADAETNNLIANGDFEMGTAGWTGIASISIGNTANSYSGNKAAQYNGQAQTLSDDYIPVDPTRDVLQLEGYAKRLAVGTTQGVLYFGYIAYDINKAAITTAPCGTYCYFAASGYTIPNDGAWHKLSSTTTGEGTVYPNFPVGTRFVRVLGLVNYGGSADAQTLIDHVTLRRINNGPLFIGNNFNTTNLSDNTAVSTIFTSQSASRLIISPYTGYGIGFTGNSVFSNNVAVGGTVNFTGLAVGTTGTGTTAVFIDASGNLYKNKLGALAFQDATAGTTYSFTNGLQVIGAGNTIGLGGTLTQNTTIGTSSWNLSFTGIGASQTLFLGSNSNIAIGTTDTTSTNLTIRSKTTNYNLFRGLASDNSQIFKFYEDVLGNGGVTFYDANTMPAIDFYGTGGGSMFNMYNNNIVTNSFSSFGNSYITGGYLGVGTSTPGYKLTVAGDFAGGGNQIAIMGVGNTMNRLYIGYDTTANYARLQAITEGTSARTLALNPDGGNVGVGTTSPLYRLQVNSASAGTIAAFYDVSNLNGIALSNTTGARNLITSSYLTGGGYIPLGLGSNGTEQLTIVPGGNVGIGTTNPAEKLDVMGNIRLDWNDSIIFNKNNDVRTLIQTSRSDTTQVGLFRTNGWGDFTFSKSVGIGYSLESGGFGVGNLLVSGNLGVGTSSPTKKLDVSGDINLTGTIFANGTSGASGYLLASTGVGLTWVNPSAIGTSVTNGLSFIGSAIGLGGSLTQNTNIGTSSFNLSFLGLGGTQALYIASNGSIGIGTTNPTNKLQLIGSNSIFSIGDTAGNELFSITDTAITSNLPTNFTSSGDVGIAYDLNFSNPTASYIKSASSLYLQAGEVFNSSPLTLRTFNSGNIVMDAGTSGAVIPYLNLTTSLGSSTNRWSNTWTNILNIGASTWSLGSPDSSRLSLFNASGLGGTESFTLLANGNVGIGVTNPLYKLNVNGDALISTRLGVGSTDVRYNLNVGGTSAFVNVHTTGNIGVNTSSPLYTLHVNGDALISTRLGIGATNSLYALNVGGTANMTNLFTSGYIGIGYTATTYPLYIGTTNSTGGSLYSVGEIAAQKFTDITNYNQYYLDPANNATTSSSLSLHQIGQIGFNSFYNSSSSQWQPILTGGSSKIQNYTNGLWLGVSGAGTSANPITNWDTNGIFLNSSGNIGIGTTNPISLLSLGVGVTPTAAAPLNNKIWVAGAAGGAGPNIQSRISLGADTNMDYGAYLGEINVDGGTGQVMQLGTRVGGADYATLNLRFGSVGIGTTNPLAKLDLISPAATTIQRWGYNDANNANSYNLSLNQVVTAGNVRWSFDQVNAGTTYANTLVLNQGNVGIGTTNPNYRLNVVGSGNIFGVGDTAGNNFLTATDTTVTSNLPANFTSSGDVSIAYDINFTNPTASYIKSQAPLVLQSGEPFNSSDLTLKTFNAGNIIMDIGSSGAILPSLDLATNLGSSTNRFNNAWVSSLYTNGYVGIGTTNPSVPLEIKHDINAGTGQLYINNPNTGSSATAMLKVGSSGSFGYFTAYSSSFSNSVLAGKAEIQGSGNPLRLASAGNITPWIEFGHNYMTTDVYMTLRSGNLGIGTTNPAQKLDVVGNARFQSIGSGTYVGAVNRTSDGTLTTATSDIRFKKDVVTIDHALDKVLQLRGVTFNWKDASSPKRMTGMIAQEVLPVMPELVFQNPTDGYYGINYGESVGLLIEAIKEQQGQIQNLTGTSLTADGQVNIDYNVSDSILASLGYTGAKNEIETAQYQLNDSLGAPVTRVAQFAKIAVTKINTGLLTATNIVTKNLVAENTISKSIKTVSITPDSEITDTISVGGTLAVADLQVTSVSALESRIQNLESKDATITGTLYADNIISKQGSFSDIVADKVSALRADLQAVIAQTINTQTSEATPSALLAQSQTWDTGIGVSQVKIEGDISLSGNLVIASKLSVTGDTQLANAFITGTFTAGEIALKDNLIETTNSNLYIQPSGEGNIHLLKDLMILADTGDVTINGNLAITGKLTAHSMFADLIQATDLQVTSLTAQTASLNEIKVATDSSTIVIAADSGFGQLATSSAQLASNATAGTATLPAGKTEIVIANPKVTGTSMVYLTPNGSTQNQVVYVKSKYISPTPSPIATDSASQPSTFTIALDQPLDHDLSINWWIIN